MNPKLLASAGLTLTILPPRWKAGAAGYTEEAYESLISKIQKFRGSIYREDGAIPMNALDPWGRHFTSFDFKNYHLLLLDLSGELAACFRLCAHSPGTKTTGLKLYEILMRMPPDLFERYHQAIDDSISKSSTEGLQIGEVGGWAVASPYRQSRATMMLPFTAWSLFQVIGDATVFTFATSRHDSARLLRRIGFSINYQGCPLPPHHDPFYGCHMELVAFNSRHPTPAYQGLVSDLRAHLLLTHSWLSLKRKMSPSFP